MYRGTVMHRRFAPRVHRFAYKVSAWLFDIDELASLNQSLRGFSWNRFNLFSFYNRDHGATDGSCLRGYVEAVCAANKVAKPHRISLLCYPRVMGFVFNPLSIFFCYDSHGQSLATIYEVRNTFAQRHSYLIVDHPQSDNKTLRHRANKIFYVSPFLTVEGDYHFRIRPPGERILIGIRHTQHNQPMLHAVFAAEQVPLTNFSLLRQFIVMPLMTLKIVAAINWEALRLWLKGIRICSKPPAPLTKISLGNATGSVPKQATQ